MDAGTMYANAKALHELLQEARAENDKLVMRLNAEHLVRQNVERENAKLRELVRDMWPSYCWANTGYEAFLTHEQDVEIRDRIRELGVDE